MADLQGQHAACRVARFGLSAIGNRPGQQITLSKYQGQPLIVNFFASWCVPCKIETPLLASFYRGEKGKMALVGMDKNNTVANATAFTRANSVAIQWDGTRTSAWGRRTASARSRRPFSSTRGTNRDRVFGKVTLADLHKGMALATAGG